MDTVLLIFVSFICFWQGVKTYNAEEQNKVFTRYPIKVNDVKKYNHFCGLLIFGFGVVAVITMNLMMVLDGIAGLICSLMIIVEAVVLMKIYRVGEKKFIVKK